MTTDKNARPSFHADLATSVHGGAAFAAVAYGLPGAGPEARDGMPAYAAAATGKAPMAEAVRTVCDWFLHECARQGAVDSVLFVPARLAGCGIPFPDGGPCSVTFRKPGEAPEKDSPFAVRRGSARAAIAELLERLTIKIPTRAEAIRDLDDGALADLLAHVRDAGIQDVGAWLAERAPLPSRDGTRLTLGIRFQTDGDFGFEGVDKVMDPGSPLYRGASVKFRARESDGGYDIALECSGRDQACRLAARDLLSGLVCALRTHKYYLVRDIVAFLSGPLEDGLWDRGPEPVRKSLRMGGNYEGTELVLEIVPGP